MIYEHAIPVTIEAALIVHSDKEQMTADEINLATDTAAIALGNDVLRFDGFSITAELMGPDPRGCVSVWWPGEGPLPDYPYPEGTECADRLERVPPVLPTTTQQEAMMNFIRAMANMTTPEDEIADPDLNPVGQYTDVADFVSDMSDDRLFDEYGTFMAMVRDARKLLAGEATADSGHVAPSPSISRLVVTVKGGIAEIADAEGLPQNMHVFMVDYDCDESDGGVHLDRIEGELCVLSLATGEELNRQNTGHFGKIVARTWEDDPTI